MFASNRDLFHRDRKPKFLSKFWTKHGGNGKRWALTPFPSLAPWPSRPPAIETPPRPVPAGPLISWPKNAPCSRILPWASCASLPPRRWAMPRHRLSLRPCTAPPSCSLQHLLKLSHLSLRPSLLHVSEWPCRTHETAPDRWDPTDDDTRWWRKQSTCCGLACIFRLSKSNRCRWPGPSCKVAYVLLGSKSLHFRGGHYPVNGPNLGQNWRVLRSWAFILLSQHPRGLISGSLLSHINVQTWSQQDISE